MGLWGSSKYAARSDNYEKFPVTKHTDNTSSEILQVKFLNADMQLVSINRKVTESGFMKYSDQKRLLLPEDVEAIFASFLNEAKTTDQLAEKKKGRDKASEIQTALDKERANQKNYFKEEIKDQYGQEPKELTSFKILNHGLSIQKPAFEYNEVFTMENFVKKAGNNYIFNIGQLMGDYKKVEEKERNRSLDVYMPYARTLSYTVSLEIPEGYRVKGLEELNKSVKNEAASFSVVASAEGNKLNLVITRIYYHNFETAASWPKLLEAMDAAAEFTSAKILLEKVK